LQNPLAPPGHAVFGLRNIQTRATVPRKPKTTEGNELPNDAPAASSNGKTNTAEPKKKSRPAPTAAKKKKPAGAPTKKTARKEPGSTPPKPAAQGRTEPTDEESRLRAYFLAERRHKLSLPGDSNHDWIEARRQLIEEAGLS
jgi:hypothetical protein